MSKTRNSNFELLRILSMLLIIAHHFAVHGVFSYGTDDLSINRFWIQLLHMGGKIGVNIFVLITGYFSVNIQKLSAKKILKFCGQLIFYSVLIYLSFAYFTDLPFSKREFLHAFFPLTYETWWFASTYFVLYLFSPYLNKLLCQLERKDYRRMLLLMAVCWCVINTVTDRLYQCNNLIWFVFLYCLAGYIKLHPAESPRSARFYFLVAAGIALCTFSAVLILDYFESIGIKLLSRVTYLYDMQKLPMLLIALTLFLAFKYLKPHHSRIINFIASAMFGVYLIHDHRSVREFLWKTLFRNAEYAQSEFLIPYSVAVILLVLIACTLLELARLYAIERPIMQAVFAIQKKRQQ